MRTRIASVLPLLLAAAVGGCAGAATPPAPTNLLPINAQATVSPSPAPTPTPSPEPTPTPRPTPTPQPTTPWSGEAAWIAGAATVVTRAGTDGTVQAHLGNAFPVELTGGSTAVGGKDWYEIKWATPGRHETGWVPAASIAVKKPDGRASASIDALDVDLAAYLRKIGSRVGVQVLDESRGTIYSYNQDKYYLVASSIKVPLMLGLLWKLEQAGRSLSSFQVSTLTAMIEHSDNDAAVEIYKEVGYQKGMNAFFKAAGVSGFSMENPVTGVGWSLVQPAAMVALLEKLHAGTILTQKDRAFALNLMTHIQSDQRVGVGDTAPKGATVAMKDGWTPGPDGYWVMNTSGIVTVGDRTYIISVYTTHLVSLQEGYDIVRHTCKVVGQKLTS